MKRLFIAVLGFAWGLLLTSLFLYVLSYLDWQHTASPTGGCSDMEHCSPRVHTLLVLSGTLFGPAVAFSSLNAAAYKRWSARRWIFAFCLVTVCTLLFYLAPYAVPRFGAR